MSATIELLAEQVRDLQAKIKTEQSSGRSTIELEAQLKKLVEQLHASQGALNESKVLKG